MLRQATIADLDPVSELIAEFMQTYKLRDMFPHMSELIPTYLGESPDRACYLAEGGIVAFEKIPELSIVRVALVYIKPEHRGEGLMDKFLNAFEDWGKKVGGRYYVLGVSTGADLTKRGYSEYEVMYMKEVK